MEKVYLILMDRECMGRNDTDYETIHNVIVGCTKTRESAEKTIRKNRREYEFHSFADSFRESENENAVLLSEYEDGEEMSVVSWTIYEMAVKE